MIDKETKRKQRKLGEKLLKRKSASKTWREHKQATAEKREKALLIANQELKQLQESVADDTSSHKKAGNYSISIAVPGSFLNNGQSAELRTYMAGQIARAATLFCVDYVIVYDETSKMTQEHVAAYWSGKWRGDIAPSDSNFESCFHLARILEYVECPQYLRKYLFPFQKPLKYAGLLNPLDAHHHLRSDDVSIPFREGVILDKPVKADRGMLCDVGLEKELELEDKVKLPAATRVTVEITNLGTESKRYRGKLSNARTVRAKTSKYWGYSLQLATNLKEAIDRKKFDLVIGTSPRGEPVSSMYVNTLSDIRILLVFGGVSGVDAALEAEEASAETRAEEAFDRLINSLPYKGTNSERVEENVFITLFDMLFTFSKLLYEVVHSGAVKRSIALSGLRGCSTFTCRTVAQLRITQKVFISQTTPSTPITTKIVKKKRSDESDNAGTLAVNKQRSTPAFAAAQADQ
ncbi:hypothetical protein RB195_009548 [Necator americanus]|uniref:Uncharacterized protein n=2 Tax=Necator americanus TaxID=51031 RepID=A0ABR1CUK4_NECAM